MILDSDQVDPTKYLTAGELDQWREGYVSKLFDLRSWVRLLTFRSNFRVILKVLLSSLKPRATRRAAARSRSCHRRPGNLNPLLPIAFETLVSKRTVLLIFSEADRLYSIYQERFAQPHQASLQRHQDKFEMFVVSEANHIFSFPEWERGMAATSCPGWTGTTRGVNVGQDGSMRKNILYVEGCRDGTVGGSHTCLYSMIANLDINRFSPTVVFYDDQNVAVKLRSRGVPTRIFKNEKPFDFGLLAGKLSPCLKRDC